MTRRDLEAYRGAAVAGRPVFFDRGLPDVLGYRRLAGLPVPESLEQLCRDLRYQPRVFIAPPWLEIYSTDSERRQLFAEAERTFHMMCKVYGELGYELVELPRRSVAERLAFVMSKLTG